jgi:SAM-dependent methyltransferase
VPRVGDIHATGYPGAHFDRVFANACYPHFDDQPAALAEIRRILKPGGVLVVSHPIGRRAVNELHRRAHPAVRGDILPAPAALEKRFAAAGFRCLRTEDEPDFYLAVLEKPATAAPA